MATIRITHEGNSGTVGDEVGCCVEEVGTDEAVGVEEAGGGDGDGDVD